jgi:hypothetical protein
MEIGERVHWFRVIADLRTRGRTVQSIADEIDVPRRTVNDWATGAHPKHADGERLISLWCRCLVLERDALPIISEVDFRI